MKKQYTKIAGVRIAYKGNLDSHFRKAIHELLFVGRLSGRLTNGGWWIIAKYNCV